jgi:hypothetical protein
MENKDGNICVPVLWIDSWFVVGHGHLYLSNLSAAAWWLIKNKGETVDNFPRIDSSGTQIVSVLISRWPRIVPDVERHRWNKRQETVSSRVFLPYRNSFHRDITLHAPRLVSKWIHRLSLEIKRRNPKIGGETIRALALAGVLFCVLQFKFCSERRNGS